MIYIWLQTIATDDLFMLMQKLKVELWKTNFVTADLECQHRTLTYNYYAGILLLTQ